MEKYKVVVSGWSFSYTREIKGGLDSVAQLIKLLKDKNCSFVITKVPANSSYDYDDSFSAAYTPGSSCHTIIDANPEMVAEIVDYIRKIEADAA